MKVVKSFIVVISFLILLTSCGTKSVKLEKPIFPESAAIGYDTSKTEVVFEIENESFEKEFAVYEISQKNIKATQINTLLKAFGFDEPEQKDSKDYTYYSEGEKRLRVYKNGSYRYEIKRESYVGDFSLTEQSVKSEAEKFLKENNLLPDGFEFVGYSKTEVSNGSTTGISGRGAVFVRMIDGHRVYGAATISVEYDSSGLVSVQKNSNEYDKEIILECETFEKLKGKILSEDAWISYGETELQEVTIVKINEWKIIYYDGSDMGETKYVQPCIRFIGIAFDKDGKSTSFSSTVPLLKEEYYKQ